MKRVFTEFKPNSIKWWEKIVLWFLPKHISCDIGSKEDANVWIVYKIFNGRFYLINEKNSKKRWPKLFPLFRSKK